MSSACFSNCAQESCGKNRLLWFLADYSIEDCVNQEGHILNRHFGIPLPDVVDSAAFAKLKL